MSNRELKLKMWQNNPKCHWCGRETKLLNIPELKGPAPTDLATIDHLISRYSPYRWTKRDNTKVLACYECNFRRAKEETDALSEEELVARGKGFSLNPRGRPVIIEALDSIDEVLDTMKKHGIIPFNESRRD